MAKKKEEALLEIKARFGTASFNKKTAKVALTVDRNGGLTLTQADKYLCESRLTASVHAEAPGDQNGQERLPGMDESVDMILIADTKKISSSNDSLSFGLTVALKGLDRALFSNLAGREGTMTITASEAIPDDEKDKGGDEDGEDAE